MKVRFSTIAQPIRRHLSVLVLMLCWLLGLILGVTYSLRADDTYFLLMRTASFSRVSIVGLATAVYLPFLIAAFVVCISKPELLSVLCLFKGFSVSCCSFAIAQVYGSAGWLIRLLFPFCDQFTAVFFLWFCMRHAASRRYSLSKDLLICSAAVVASGVLDIYWISPFLVKIIDR